MKANTTTLQGVLLIESEPAAQGKGECSSDERGGFVELYNKEKYAAAGISIDFVEDDMSFSKKDVLRGIHGNDKTWKLVSCLHGRVMFVVVNCDPNSASFGKWEAFDLGEHNHRKVLVPPLHGSAYLALTDKVIFSYKQSTYYVPGQFTYRWNEPKFGIKWPIAHPILSERDASVPLIGD
jgi:dTDP-4-dehydrorhamnose 3,5-epimerase